MGRNAHERLFGVGVGVGHCIDCGAETRKVLCDDCIAATDTRPAELIAAIASYTVGLMTMGVL